MAILFPVVDPISILVTILGFSVVIIVHETGHYLAARAFGMRVLQYSIGFGPTLFKWKPKDSDTEFLIGAIPFLAYVRVAGMNPFEEHDEGDEGLFNDKSVLARIVTIAAGPFANYLLAVIVFFGLFATHNMPSNELVEPPQADLVVLDSPAHQAGILAGDVFIAVNGESVESFQDVVRITQARGGMETAYVMERDGERMEFTVTPEDSAGVPRIGVQGATRDILVGFDAGESFERAMMMPWLQTVGTVVGIGEMIRKKTMKGMGGPVQIASMIHEAAAKGWQHYASIIALISVAIGVFNLFPFPGLDGGRLTFLGYEVITRRQPNQHIETAMHVVGILLLLCLMVVVTYKDLFGSGEEEPAAAASSAPDSDTATAPANDPHGTQSPPAASEAAAP